VQPAVQKKSAGKQATDLGRTQMLQDKNNHSLIRPWDKHNQLLVSQVHPLDWKNLKSASRYNLVAIGAGTAGLVSASRAAANVREAVALGYKSNLLKN